MRGLVCWLALVAAAHSQTAPAERPLAFNRDIRPLLQENCMACHGGIKRKGGFSFLFESEVFGKGESGNTVVVPGSPETSELVRRIRSTDPEERMPPTKARAHGLAPVEIGLLERWIKEGAIWELPWTLQKPVEFPLPVIHFTSWPKADLDRFVLAGLEAQEMSPSPEATPAEWLRRITLDLTGLPPSSGEWKKFQQDALKDKEAAMAAAVDHLLASSHYGERWASVWLDLARYADTTGFERDPHRDVWSFRDWVIRAFNNDMPFDRFTLKQLAGDLAEKPDPGDLIATAFHRNTRTNTEGGSDDEEFRVAAVIDRVNTTWTVWQGTTFACAQCHDHPSEPIRQSDYYRFLAYFDQTEDCDLNNDFPSAKLTEEPAQQAEADDLDRKIRLQRTSLNDEARTVAEKLRNWKPFITGKAVTSSPEGTLSQGDDGTFTAHGTIPTQSSYVLTGKASPFSSLKLDILPMQAEPAEWRGQGAVVSKLEVEVVKPDGHRTQVKFREVVADFLAGPFDPNDSLEEGPGGFGDFPMAYGPRTAWFVPEEPVAVGEGDTLEIRITHQAVCNGNEQSCVLRRFRIALSDDPALTTFLARQERAARWTDQRDLLLRYQEIQGATVPVMREREWNAYRTTRAFTRGNRLAKAEVAAPGIPPLYGGAAIAGPPAGNRLDVAEWLMGEENPLSARVVANRLWAELLGTGLVETQENFGGGGSVPSNQTLLDFLALRLLRQHRWQLKPFLREIALSATYRQSGKVTPDQLQQDPPNRLLGRGPRQRLSAEMVRDQALMISGLWNERMDGQPVFPPQPAGIWRTVNSQADWIDSRGENRYRRAIYTYVKRTSGYPPFLSFDAPDREICTARRITTNTPLQALVTLNDPAHLEFAQGFAKRMFLAGNDPESRIRAGYHMVFLDDPSMEVVGVLTRLRSDLLDTYRLSPEEAASLAATPEEAAWVMIASTLLNSDAALNR